MTISEITAEVVAQHSAKIIKARPAVKGQPIDYEVREGFPSLPTEPEARLGWFAMDATTAHAMNTVWAALKPANQALWDKLALSLLIEFTWASIR